ncbi:MAG TPA: Rieske 2Fe-2S domain-containing protein [Blastocatellia bacterium]|nr:Rieske 2Fe-2S domain-containing protein [Blastocatellia bacterium]
MSSDSPDKSFHKFTEIQNIPSGSGKASEINGQEIAVFNDEGQLYAIDNSCPHRGAPLHEGILRDGKVYCPWHCFDFDIKTGECGAVKGLDVNTYEVKVEEGTIYVKA